MADRTSADERALRRELQELAKKREALDNSSRRGSGATAGNAGRRSVFARLGGEPTRTGDAGRQAVQLKENNARGNASWRLGKRDYEDNRQSSMVKRQRLHSAVARPEGAHHIEERAETSRAVEVTSPTANNARTQERKQRAVAPYAQKDGIARSRRMFGALMGHLGKAKRQIEKDTDLFKRQDTKQQEAEQREKMQSQNLEKQARHEAEIARLEALVTRTELDRSEQIARAKLEHLQMVRKSESQSKFLVTITSPPIYYLPLKHTKETKELVAASMEAHEAKMKSSERTHEENLRKLEAEFATKLEQLREELDAAKGGEKNKVGGRQVPNDKREDAIEDGDEEMDQVRKESEKDNQDKHVDEDMKVLDGSPKESIMEVEDEDIEKNASDSEAEDNCAVGTRRSDVENTNKISVKGKSKSGDGEDRVPSPNTVNGASVTRSEMGASSSKGVKVKQVKEEESASPKQNAQVASRKESDETETANQSDVAANSTPDVKTDNDTAMIEILDSKQNQTAQVVKMKVTELRAELKKRGLDTKGLKAKLVQRLKQAMHEEDESK